MEFLPNAQWSSISQAAHKCSPARRQRNRRRMALHRLKRDVLTCLATAPAQTAGIFCDRSAGPLECGRTCLMTAVTGSTSGISAPVQKTLPQSPVHEVEPTCSASLEVGRFLKAFLERSALPLAGFFQEMVRAERAGQFVPPSKNIFPLPRFCSWPCVLKCSSAMREVHLLCANLLVATLNFLEQGMPKQLPCGFRAARQCNAAQASVHRHLAQRTQLFLSNLDAVLGNAFPWQGSFHKFEAQDRSRYEAVRGKDVDLPNKAGTCNPASLVPPDLWRLVADPALVFPSGHDGRLADDLRGQHSSGVAVRQAASSSQCAGSSPSFRCAKANRAQAKENLGWGLSVGSSC